MAQGNESGAQPLTGEQISRMLQHGPWPAAWQPDPSNRVSGRADAAALGRRLFFDARLSPSGRVSCSSCHRPERSWSDGRPRGIGLRAGQRNTPALTDVRLNRWFGWSGAGDSLWGQSLRPILDPNEMGSSAAHVKAYLGSHAELSEAYAAVFGRLVARTEAQEVLIDAGKALAAFQETIVSGRTPFDAFRDALGSNDLDGQSRYPAAARRGLVLFIGAAGCRTCHSGPAFTDGAFHVTHVHKTKLPDRGRIDGIVRLLASPYSLAGRFSDDPAHGAHWRKDELMHSSPPAGAFRTPTLRNLTHTAPYLHDGSQPSLGAVLRTHPTGGPRLNDRDRRALEAFLVSLSASAAGAKPAVPR